MSPPVPGTWFWTSDKELMFTPKGGLADRHDLQGKDVLAGDSSTRASSWRDYRFDFSSAPFSAKITESLFYQDPVDPNLKKLVASVQFSHPVDNAQFERHVSLSLAKDAQYLGLEPDSRFFTVVYDKFDLAAHIHSAALAMPRDDTPMTLQDGQRCPCRARRQRYSPRSSAGGRHHPRPLEPQVFRRAHDAGGQRPLRARADPAWFRVRLPSRNGPSAEISRPTSFRCGTPTQPAEQRQPYQWTSQEKIGKDILDKSQPLPLSYVPSEEGGNTQHGFKFRPRSAGMFMWP